VGVMKDGTIKPNVIMNTGAGLNIDQSVRVWVDGNYIGVPIGDNDCTTRKRDHVIGHTFFSSRPT